MSSFLRFHNRCTKSYFELCKIGFSMKRLALDIRSYITTLLKILFNENQAVLFERY